MRLGTPYRTHLVQDRGHPGARQLPRRLAAGETAADDVDGLYRGGVHTGLRVAGRAVFKATNHCEPADPAVGRSEHKLREAISTDSAHRARDCFVALLLAMTALQA